MKILYVVGAYGRRYLANEIYRELLVEYARRGHECVAFAGVTPGELGDEPACYDDGPIRVERAICRNTGWGKVEYELSRRLLRYPRWLALWRGYRRVLRAHPDVDVVHADAAYPIGALVALATPRHIAVVPSIHGGDVIDYPGYGYGRFAVARVLLRYTWRRSALVRVNSPLMAARAVALGCPPAKLHEILVNIGDRFFASDGPLVAQRAAARSAVAAAHGLAQAAPLVLAVGRLLPLKGFADAVAAWPAIRAAHPAARLVIAGPDFVDPATGDQRAALQSQIAALGLECEVLLLPGLDYETAMPRYLAAADVLLAVAHIEGLNRVVAEAGSLGTPAVVSDTTGIAPLVAQLGAGPVIPAHAPADLAAAVQALLAAPAQRARYAAQSRRLAQRFRSAVVADQLLALYAAAREITRISL